MSEPPNTSEAANRGSPQSAVGSEADLSAALKAGDRQAIAELYDLHASHVYTLARRIVRNEPDAESVVSDVFLELWRKPERFNESRGGFRTYLLVLTRSRALDTVRSKARREELNRSGGQLMADEKTRRSESQRPLSRAIRSENNQLLADALEQLDDKQRDPLRLAYFEGLTHRQIADRLNEPLGTVKTRVRAALQALRAKLRTVGRHDDELP